MKKLYYFTDSYPFSVDYTWKTEEVKEAAKQFNEVIIVPFTYKKDNDFKFPGNVRICPPTLGSTLFAKPKYLRHLFSKSQPQNWGKELFKVIFKGKQAVIDWYLATVYSEIIVRKPIFDELKSSIKNQENTVLFFQWTMNNALLIPILNKWGYQHIICRMHGFDLYEFRHNNYLPYKSILLKHAKTCTFISQHGLNYAKNLYPFLTDKSVRHYLGAKAIEQNKVDRNQKFNLVSVSRVVPLKRIELIVEALKHVRTPIKWTHIGDGYVLDDIKDKAATIETYNKQCEVEFLGWLNPEAIEYFFAKNGINALILVSETEGLPVVIMEAFSASIPVIATDVGGVSELVNKTNGVLLASNPEVGEIVDAIELLANEPAALSQLRREEAFKSYSKSFDLINNSKEFIDFLSEQCH